MARQARSHRDIKGPVEPTRSLFERGSIGRPGSSGNAGRSSAVPSVGSGYRSAFRRARDVLLTSEGGRGNVAAVTMATSSRAKGSAVFYALLATSTVLLLATIYVVFLRAPIEAQMGIVQKIFYFHVPCAYSMYIGATAC